MWPKIFVITPAFGGARYMQQTLASVAAQNYPNIEYIVVDGGSADETPEIIREHRGSGRGKSPASVGQ